MRLRKKKSLLDQASDYVDTVRPQVEAAVAQAREAVEDFVETTARPALADAKVKAGPALADARVKAATSLADAREKAAPVIADARDKAVPLVTAGAAVAGDKATAAKTMAALKVAELKGTPPPKKKGGGIKRLLLLTGLAGLVAVAAKKLRGGDSPENWQSSYVPQAAPAGDRSPGQTTTTPAAPVGTATAATPLADEVAHDIGGASPDEAIADATETPHEVTTPDQPADVTELDGGRP